VTRSRVAYLIATIGGLGDRLPAPGTTAGSMPASALWWLAAIALSSRTLLIGGAIGTAVSTAVAIWSCEVEARRRSSKDPRAIAIDEVAGQWLCLLVAWALARPEGIAAITACAAASFLAFRFFDVVKPWPIRRLEGLAGGVGIVADDLLAGAVAGLAVGLGWRVLV
jgi:phosphatidylglycerophosphatase A